MLQSNSALHDNNSVNKSPSGVGGSGVFSSSSGAVTQPFLAIKSGGSPFLLGALNGSPATTAPNGDHAQSNIFEAESFADKRRRLQHKHVPSPVWTSCVYNSGSASSCDAANISFSGLGPLSISTPSDNKGNIMASHHNSSGVGNQCLDSAAIVPPVDSPPVSTIVALASIANTAVSGPLASSTNFEERPVLQSANSSPPIVRGQTVVENQTVVCTSFVERPVLQSNTLNENAVDSVSPPPRDDVPPFETGSTFVFVESDCINNVPDRGSSGNSLVDEYVSVQTCEVGMVGHLGLPRGLAIGDDDGADAGVPRWLTRLFHPPER